MALYLAKRAKLYAALVFVGSVWPALLFWGMSVVLGPLADQYVAASLGTFFAGWLGPAGYVFWRLTRQARRGRAVLRGLSKELGFAVDDSGSRFGLGDARSLRVEVGPADAAGQDAYATKVTIPSRAWRWRSRAEPPSDTPSTPTGDPEFDAVVALRRPGDDLVAVLQPWVRGRLARLVEAGLVVRGSSYEQTFPTSATPEDVTAALLKTVDLARALRLGEDAAPALAVRAGDPDELPAIRDAAARRLLRGHADSPDAHQLARELLDGDDPGLALLAARVLGVVTPELEAAAAARGGGLAVADDAGGGLSEVGTQAGQLSEAVVGELSEPSPDERSADPADRAPRSKSKQPG